MMPHLSRMFFVAGWLVIAITANAVAAVDQGPELALLQHRLACEQFLPHPLPTVPGLDAPTPGSAALTPINRAALSSLFQPANASGTIRHVSDTNFAWNGTQWTTGIRVTYSYDPAGQLTELLGESWNGAQWGNSYKNDFGCDGNGQLISDTLQVWTVDHWENQNRHVYTYDAGSITEALTQLWQSGAWVNVFRTLYAYSGGHPATIATQVWKTNAWADFGRSIYTYDGQGLLAQLFEEDWNGVAWVDHYRVIYTYDGSMRLSQLLIEVWHASAWVNSASASFVYDMSGNQILQVQSNWSGLAWVAVEADTSHYSGGKRVIDVRNHIEMDSVDRALYAYDGWGNLAEQIEQGWKSGAWINSARMVHVYIDYVCACACHGDPACDSVIDDILDVATAINIAFRGDALLLDPSPTCPFHRTDVNCSGETDVTDVVRIINVAFRRRAMLAEFCRPCGNL